VPPALPPSNPSLEDEIQEFMNRDRGRHQPRRNRRILGGRILRYPGVEAIALIESDSPPGGRLNPVARAAVGGTIRIRKEGIVKRQYLFIRCFKFLLPSPPGRGGELEGRRLSAAAASALA
jgi:hypothetical protein